MEILNKIQKELKAPKGQTNNFGGYKYRSCEDILEAVKPLLGKATLIIKDEIVMLGDRFYVKATATLTEGEVWTEATAYAREPLAKKGMDEAQITGATSSYARKYALNGLFCIDDTKDADSTNNHGKAKKTKTDNSIDMNLACSVCGSGTLISPKSGNPYCANFRDHMDVRGNIVTRADYDKSKKGDEFVDSLPEGGVNA